MPLPRTYTERIGCYMRGEHRAELQRVLPTEIGLGAALRDAGLRAIGRENLVRELQREERGNRRPRESAAEHATIGVHTTVDQKAALQQAARDAGKSLSALLLDALRAELGLEPVDAENVLGGWTRGKRRSRKPPR